jgi:hypothetical protein
MKKQNKKRIWSISFGHVSLVQKALFAKHLAVMIKAGVSIVEALAITRQSAEGKLKKVLGEVQKSVESGHSLSESFSRHPRVFNDFQAIHCRSLFPGTREFLTTCLSVLHMPASLRGHWFRIWKILPNRWKKKRKWFLK